jgi:hypothetical protein
MRHGIEHLLHHIKGVITGVNFDLSMPDVHESAVTLKNRTPEYSAGKARQVVPSEGQALIVSANYRESRHGRASKGE